ncbi:peptide methionine sulfoxide reductase MsrA [Novosphingobium marinum]|uniref:Peptide methionine sulfoxide reductase MsrA n=1 Tax=Novosphingobium marinum TaxID=1514948 RepID=A0A7Z0BUS8_9SPHN|nr:peptide-methionine (S)-S-oxide reductase MsrA [Novosphingobium marinum]NYH94625.1 peptide-methionine (S)-S-oxide reductase [Novosphingobium marinum]GGC38649.1 peptide methionine sulfoxide reductase MsrA [Novosphingobium marinum]
MRRAALLAPVLALAAACQQPAVAAEKVVRAPVAGVKAQETGKLSTAIFAGGCFWGVEGVFSHVKGVKSAVSGYHGGKAASARYDVVSSGMTQHAEAVKVVYDPSVIRYDQLLRILFSVVTDPTQRNRQGPDVGAHYRSAIVPLSAEQRKVAQAYLKQLGSAKLWDKPIVTKIESPRKFYPAEAYHQDFMAKNPKHGYIVRWDAPKVRALSKMYPGVYKASFTRD